MSYADHNDVFGEVATNRAILIRVKNADMLARSQGSMAALAQGLAPATIEAKVVDEVASKLRSALTQQHVDAEVSVVEPNAFQSASGSHIATDVAFAIGGAGVFAVIWYLFAGRK